MFGRLRARVQQRISEQQDLMHIRLRGRRKCSGHCSLVMLFSFSRKELNTITYLLIFRSIAGRRHLVAAGDRRAKGSPEALSDIRFKVQRYVMPPMVAPLKFKGAA